MSETTLNLDMVLDGKHSQYLLGPLAGLELARFVPHPPPIYILDETVAHLHAPWIEQIQAACDDHAPPTLVLPGGEKIKTMAGLEKIYAWLASHSVARDKTLVAVGGGSILDITGLAAATWRRGLNLVTVPTTLLAMVDAALGGKTALNAAGLKNSVGCFHPASGIIADPGFLATLTRQSWRDGLAELIKTAIIGDPQLFSILHASRPRLDNLFATGEPDQAVPRVLGSLDWKEWIGRAAAVKASIVTKDFREKGLRKSLNLGHTLGHALEGIFLAEPEPLSHGQAVAIGMAVVFRVAAERNLCPLDEAVRVIEVLEACGLPTRCRAPSLQVLDKKLLGDKKQSSHAGLEWVMPRGIGHMDIHGRVKTAELLKWLD